MLEITGNTRSGRAGKFTKESFKKPSLFRKDLKCRNGMIHEYCVHMNFTGITNLSTIKEIDKNTAIPTTMPTTTIPTTLMETNQFTVELPLNKNGTKLEWCNLDKYDVIIKTRVKADT